MREYSKTPILEVKGAVKRFRKGPTIGPISFTVFSGEVYALIGPNGSGKTTTLRMVVGVYKPDNGVIRVCNREPSSLKGYAAYVPEESAVYPKLTGFEHLVFYATLYTGDRSRAKRIAERAAEIAGLGDAIHRNVETYSKGMRRRLLLGLALALPTPLLVLDEPTSGLDVGSAVMIRKLIRSAAEAGRAVLMSSHNMFEVQYLADRVAFIAKGIIIAEGTPEQLMERFSARNLEEAYVNALKSAGVDFEAG